MWPSQDQYTPSPLQSTLSLHDGSSQHSALKRFPATAFAGHPEAGLSQPPRNPVAGLSNNNFMSKPALPLAGTLPGASRQRLQQIAEAQQHHANSRLAFAHKQPRLAPSRQLNFADPRVLPHSQPEPDTFDQSQQIFMTQPSQMPSAAHQVLTSLCTQSMRKLQAICRNVPAGSGPNCGLISCHAAHSCSWSSCQCWLDLSSRRQQSARILPQPLLLCSCCL